MHYRSPMGFTATIWQQQRMRLRKLGINCRLKMYAMTLNLSLHVSPSPKCSYACIDSSGPLFQVIHPGPLSILQKRFISSFTHFQSVISFKGLSLPLSNSKQTISPLCFLPSKFMFELDFYGLVSIPGSLSPKRGNLEDALFPTLRDQHYRRCEKIKTVH